MDNLMLSHEWFNIVLTIATLFRPVHLLGGFCIKQTTNHVPGITESLKKGAVYDTPLAHKDTLPIHIVLPCFILLLRHILLHQWNWLPFLWPSESRLSTYGVIHYQCGKFIFIRHLFFSVYMSTKSARIQALQCLMEPHSFTFTE